MIVISQCTFSQCKTRQDKAKTKTSQDMSRQIEARQDKTRQDKTRQEKSQEDKTRHDKTRQSQEMFGMWSSVSVCVSVGVVVSSVRCRPLYLGWCGVVRCISVLDGCEYWNL